MRLPLCRNIQFNYCILDEGHVIKNGKTKLSKAVKQLAANFRVILSGTPIQVSGGWLCAARVCVRRLVCDRRFPSSEQRSGAVVSVRLPHARLPRNGAPVRRSLRKAHPGQPRRQELLPGAGSWRPGHGGAPPTGAALSAEEDEGGCPAGPSPEDHPGLLLQPEPSAGTAAAPLFLPLH